MERISLTGVAPFDGPLIGLEDLLKAENEGAAALGLAVYVPVDADYQQLAPFLSHLRLVEIRFDAFTDGRGFTLARRLRRDLGYKGEIRVTGPVLPDQALFLVRTGVDTVDVAPERSEAFLAALGRFGVFYQRAGDQMSSIADLRQKRSVERLVS